MTWKCPIYLDDISFDFNELPFAFLSEESFISMVRTDPLFNESSQCDSDNDHLGEIAPKINTSPNDSRDESDLSPIDWFASNINSYYKRNLKIGHLNVNSIYGKADEVMDLLNTCRFDIFFVAESNIDGSVNSSLFAHSEYRIIRRDRKKGGGGILVHIRRSITALRRAILEPDGVESICLDVKGCGNTWFLLCACYRSLVKCKISDFLSSCVLAAEKMYTKRKEVMFLGDFNIDMLTENESSVGSSYSLSNFCDQFCLTNTISVPTRVTASTKTLLDVIPVSHPERFVSSSTLRLGISDHDLIYIARKQRLPKPNVRCI